MSVTLYDINTQIYGDIRSDELKMGEEYYHCAKELTPSFSRKRNMDISNSMSNRWINPFNFCVMKISFYNKYTVSPLYSNRYKQYCVGTYKTNQRDKQPK